MCDVSYGMVCGILKHVCNKGWILSYPQVPRYSSLKKLLSEVLQYFLVCDVDATSPSDNISSSSENALAPHEDAGAEAGQPSHRLELRMKKLQQHVDQLPRNKEDKEKLLSSGYSPLLWEKVLLYIKNNHSICRSEYKDKTSTNEKMEIECFLKSI